jgi:hypothetical protein
MRILLASSLVLTAVVGCDCDTVVVSQPGSIEGPVCNDLDGQPARDVVVVVVNDAGVVVEVDEPLRTDENGTLKVGGLPVSQEQNAAGGALYDLRLTGPGFRRTIVGVPVLSAQTHALSDDACRPPPTGPGLGAVAGTFCATHVGGVIAGAPVTIRLSDGTTIETTTDENGTFQEEVPAGNINVIVGGPIGKTYGALVVEGATTIVEQQLCDPPPFLSTQHITGTVCLNPDDDISTATVKASWRDNGAIIEVDGTIDASGAFDIDGIAPCPVFNVNVEVIVSGRRRMWNIDQVVGRSEAEEVSVNGLPVVDDAPGDDCTDLLPDDQRRYLVVKGAFDSIETALARAQIANVEIWDGTSTLWANQLFAAADRLERYDAVFVNCGVLEDELINGLSLNTRVNLVDYIEGGGRLYVSDHSYDLIEQVFPDAIRFFGDEDVNSSAELSQGDRTYAVDVVDPELAASLEVDTFDIEFSFQAGTVIQTVDASTNVFLTTDLQLLSSDPEPLIRPDTPLTVSFTRGAGLVIFSAFHQEKNGATVEELAEDGPEDRMLQELVLRLQ